MKLSEQTAHNNSLAGGRLQQLQHDVHKQQHVHYVARPMVVGKQPLCGWWLHRKSLRQFQHIIQQLVQRTQNNSANVLVWLCGCVYLLHVYNGSRTVMVATIPLRVPRILCAVCVLCLWL